MFITENVTLYFSTTERNDLLPIVTYNTTNMVHNFNKTNKCLQLKIIHVHYTISIIFNMTTFKCVP